jgi:hypothetical protein
MYSPSRRMKFKIQEFHKTQGNIHKSLTILIVRLLYVKVLLRKHPVRNLTAARHVMQV